MDNKLEEIELEDLDSDNDNENVITELEKPTKKMKLTPFMKNVIHVSLIILVLLIGIILLVTVESLIKDNYDRAIRIHYNVPFIDASNSLPFIILYVYFIY